MSAHQRAAASKAAWAWWASIGSPKLIAAPMVLQSELAFRTIMRSYGAQLCYTPMITANLLLRDLQRAEEARGGASVTHRHDREFLLKKNGFDALGTAHDRPLIAQLAANNPEDFIQAALVLQEAGGIDAIDLNLGCPQARAERDNFGAFLLRDSLPLVCEIVTAAARSPELSLPVTVKIRRASTAAETVAIVEALVDAGASLVCIHGRPIGVKNHQGPADHSHIALVKKSLAQRSGDMVEAAGAPQGHVAEEKLSLQRSLVPVVANGNIWTLAEADAVLRDTKCDGVMAASGLLHNPRMFLRDQVLEGSADREVRDGVEQDALAGARKSDLQLCPPNKPQIHTAHAAISWCREYLSAAKKHVPFHPKTIQDHLMNFLRPALAPTWKREPNSGTDEWADLWIALCSRFLPGRTKLVRRASGKVAVKHACPTGMQGKGPPGGNNGGDLKKIKSCGARPVPAPLESKPLSDGHFAMEYYTGLVDEVEARCCSNAPSAGHSA